MYAAARIGSWALLSAWVYRTGGALDFGLLALVRGTIGILNYTSLGLAPAMIRLLAESRRNDVSSTAAASAPLLNNRTISYQIPAPGPSPEQIVFTNGLVVAALAACVGFVVTLVYSANFVRIFIASGRVQSEGPTLVLVFGMGTVARLFSDAAGALLQTRGRIALDNWLLTASEFIWVVLSVGWGRDGPLIGVSTAYGFASAALLAMRFIAVNRLDHSPIPVPRWINGSALRRILSIGFLIWFAQLADYLYSPTDYILIGHFLSTYVASVYAPALQIDSGLLVLVAGLASVMLPRAALAHAADDSAAVRRYYVRGTLASLALLAVAALVILLLSPLIFRAWLGNSMPATRVILPLVLIHTVIGGSSAVGRSVLLGTGRVKPFTISVLVAGATNVIVSWALVRFTNLGLVGIVLGTIVAVVGRCALWMPWYVMRSLRQQPDQSAVVLNA